jgi:hypothetical protein
MNRRSILTKTGKGLMEATGKTSNLSRDLRNILKEMDGKVSVSELTEKFPKLGESKLLEALSSMERDGYVREFVGKQEEGPRAPVASGPGSQSLGDGSDLDFTAFTPAKPNAKANEDARLQAQAQEIARQAQATRAREELAAKAARAKAEADLKARQAAAAKPAAPVTPPFAGILGAGPDAQVRAQADAQARAQAEALERARREAEEKARRDAEEKARREAEARAKAEIEAAIKREADARALREIQERTRREEEEKARREAETRAKLEAEQRVKREAEERTRREIEERARKEVEERIRREEVERRRREEEEHARREAEERERRKREEEERARREAERQARIEAETRTRVDAEVRGKREAEERARREEEEHRREQQRKRAEEEARKRREAEEAEALVSALREEQEKAQREAEEPAKPEEEESKEQEERGEQEEPAPLEEEAAEQRREEEEQQAREEEKHAREEEKAQARAAAKARKAERARERAGEEAWRGDEEALRDPNAPSLSAAEAWEKRKPASLAKTLAVMLLVLLIVGIAVLPFVPLETAPYEKEAQAWLGQPVKIGSVTLSLLPLPQLRFEKVVIGKDPQMRAAAIKANPELATLLEDRVTLRSLELDNVTVPKEFLAVLLQDKGARKGFGVQRITAKGLKVDAPELGLPPLELDASLSPDGTLTSASFSGAGPLSVKVEPRGGRAAIEISAGTLPLPVGIDLGFSDFTGKGTVTASELVLNTTEARAFGGRIFGNVRLRWSSGWSLEGELSARQMDAVKIAGPLLGGGTVQGKGRLSMRGLLPERMILNSQLEGNFTIQKGSVSNVDMTRLLQGSGSGGGTTLFSEMSGDFSADPNRLAVRNIRLAAGLLNGVGQIEMDPLKNLSGRMQIELRAQSVQARSTVGLSGTLTNPQFRRTN